MYVRNKTSKPIVLTEVLAGGNFEIPANGTSINLACPNKKLLEKLIQHQKEVEVHVTTASEINVITEMDNRYETILILD